MGRMVAAAREVTPHNFFVRTANDVITTPDHTFFSPGRCFCAFNCIFVCLKISFFFNLGNVMLFNMSCFV